MLLPEIALEGARITAEKVRRIVESTPLKVTSRAIRCTVSLGVRDAAAEDAAPEDLYKRADERLYEAKQGGRNRVAG